MDDAILLMSFDLPADGRCFDGVQFNLRKPGNYEFRCGKLEPIRTKLEPGRYLVRVSTEEPHKIECHKLP